MTTCVFEKQLIGRYALAPSLNGGVPVDSLRVTALTAARMSGADMLELQRLAERPEPESAYLNPRTQPIR